MFLISEVLFPLSCKPQIFEGFFFLLPDFHLVWLGLQNEVIVISIQISAYLSLWQVSPWILYTFSLTVWPTSPSLFLLWPLNTTFNLSLAALANYSVTKTKVPVHKYRGEVDPDIEIMHLSLFYLLLILPYSVQPCAKYCFNCGLPHWLVLVPAASHSSAAGRASKTSLSWRIGSRHWWLPRKMQCHNELRRDHVARPG